MATSRNSSKSSAASKSKKNGGKTKSMKGQESASLGLSPAVPMIEALEARLVFDGAMDATLNKEVLAKDLLACTDFPAPESQRNLADESTLPSATEPLVEQLSEQQTLLTEPAATQEIIFIDSRVEDADILRSSFANNAEVHLIQSNSDGVEQIAAALNGRVGIDAIHIISHGRSGTLDLGSTKLTEASIESRHADELAIIRSALSSSADIMLYGCNFGAGSRGEAAIAALSLATGADVAASEDTTGAAFLGGDWVLEDTAGTIEATSIAAPDWQHTLTTVSASQLTGGLSGATSTVVTSDNTVTFTRVSGPNGLQNDGVGVGFARNNNAADHVLQVGFATAVSSTSLNFGFLNNDAQVSATDGIEQLANFRAFDASGNDITSQVTFTLADNSTQGGLNFESVSSLNGQPNALVPEGPSVASPLGSFGANTTGVLTLTSSGPAIARVQFTHQNITDTRDGESSPFGVVLQGVQYTNFVADNDSDGVVDATDIDDDNDGILDATEGGAVDIIALGGFNGLGNGVNISSIPGWTFTSSPGASQATIYSANTSVIFVADNATQSLTQSGLTGLNFGPGSFGAAQVEMLLRFGNSGPATSAGLSAMFEVVVGGTIYARVATSAGQGTLSTITYLNGAAGTWNGSSTATPSVGGAAGTLLVDLPAGVASAGDIQLRFISGVGPSDDVYVDNIKVLVNKDTDNDGIVDRLDIDSDDDGITDTIEAQTSGGFVAPSGTFNAVGLDTAYVATNGLTPVNTDNADVADYLDSDSDNDFFSDLNENGLNVPSLAANAADADNDGLKDVFETVIDGNVNDGYKVSEGVIDPLAARFDNNSYLSDQDADSTPFPTPMSADLDYRDAVFDIFNSAPTTTGGSQSFAEDGFIAFQASDFNFADADQGDMIESIEIVTLPALGSLTLDSQPVMAGVIITAADITNLRYTPAANASDLNYSSFTYKVSDGDAQSDIGIMVLNGGPSNDSPIVTVSLNNNGTVVALGSGVTPRSLPAAVAGVTGSISVTSLLAQLSISDIEQSNFGIGVVSADETNGVWQYDRTDIPGHGWVDFQLNDGDNLDTTPVPDGQVILFNSDTILRFVPKAGFSGQSDITFKIWDQSVGTASNDPSTILNDAGGLPPTATSSLSATTFLARTATDYDGDAVADADDLDDDNDGILDTVEGFGVSVTGGKNIVLVIDESGSIDATEQAQIRAGLTDFINSQIGSGNTVSFIGMSPQDTNNRTDHVLSVTFPVSGTDVTAAFDTWIAGYGYQNPSNGLYTATAQEDFWASGLEVVNTLSLGAGDQVIIVADGAQGRNPTPPFLTNSPGTAATQAALIEATGAHLFAIGVTGANSPGYYTSTGTLETAVGSIFDNVVGTTGNPVQQVTDYSVDFETSEYDAVTDFSGLASALGNLGRAVGVETNVDTDGDGVVDRLDLDSDNDGISDLIESGAAYTTVDAGNNGVYDSGVNAQGIPTAANAGAGVTPVNTDGTGAADFRDLDSDDDGIPDAVEARPTAGYTPFTNINNASNFGVNDTGLFAPSNTDGTGLADYRDTDSDDDAILDSAESGLTPGADANGDGIGDGIGASYANADGTINAPLTALTNTDSDTSNVDYRSLNVANTAPADGNETNTVTQNQTLTVADGATGDLLNNAIDAEGDTLSITGYSVAGVTGTPTLGTAFTIPNVGSITISSNGSYSFAPVTNFTGTIPVITYTVSDGTLIDTSTLTLSMTAVNQNPIAADDGPIAVTEDQNATGNVITGPGADTDPENATLTVVDFTVTGVPGPILAGQTATIPNVGTLVINANGDFTFDPADNYTGPVPSATYNVSDGTLTDTAVLSFANVTAVNDVPLDGSENPSTNQDVTLTVPAATGLLANTVDPDGPTPSITGYTVAGVSGTPTLGSPFTIPNVGSITISADGAYTFDPLPAFTGAVPAINYTVSDGTLSDPSVLNLSVNATGDNDGDGTADVNDLDDDNDGILDSVEGFGVSVSGGKNIVLVIDESGSIDATEQAQIRAGLTDFINSQIGSGNTVSFIGMSPQDTNNRTDHVLSVTFPTSGTDVTAAFDTWIAGYGYQNPSTGLYTATAQEDFWASGLEVVNTLTLGAGDQVIIVADGAQGRNPTPPFLTNSPGTAATQAALIEATGAHLFAIGVTGANSPGYYTSAGTLETAVGSVFDNVAGTTGNPVQQVTDYSVDFETSEYDAVVDFSGLAAALGNLGRAVGVETNVDTDGDGVADQFDLDSDNDGISDLIESGANAAVVDTNNDGIYDSGVNAQGIPTTANAGAGVTPVNTDGTGPADFRDLDSDDDGIADAIEARATAGYASATSNNNDTNKGVNDNGLFVPVNTDGTGLADYRDTDADDDTFLDSIESGLVPGVDNNGDGIGDTLGASYSNPDGNISNPLTQLTNLDTDATNVDYRSLNNVAPVDGNETNSVTQNQTLTVPVATGLLANTVDPDGATPTVTGYTVAGVTGTPTIGTAFTIPNAGSITINANGSYSFAPVINYTGAIPVITYTVSDGTNTDTSTLTLSITAVNQAPVATDDGPVAVTEDQNTTGNVITGLGADTDPEGTTLTVTEFIVAGVPDVFTAGTTATIPGVGTLVINANGDFTFNPDPNYTGPIPSATYIVSDGDLIDEAVLSFANVTAVNDAPVDSDEANTVTQNQTLTVPVATGLLANTVDPDGAAATVTGYTVAGVTGTPTIGAAFTIPSVGSITINADGSYAFAPVTNYTGAIPVITYTVSDGTATDTSTLTLSLTAVNQNPDAVNDGPVTVTEDQNATGNVITGPGADSDPENATLTVTEFTVAGVTGTFAAGTTATIPGVGTLVINANGDFTFDPADNYYGPVPSATYTLSDGALSDSAILSFANVTPINDAPVDGDETNLVTQNQTLTVADGAVGDLLNNATDAEGSTLSITGYTVAGVIGTPTIGAAFTIPGVGDITINANGSYAFTPVTNYTGVIPVITYTVSDGGQTIGTVLTGIINLPAATDTSTLTLSLTAVNQNPDAVNDGPITVTEDNNATGNVITGPGADNDPEGSTLTVTSFDIPGVGPTPAGTTATIPGVGTLVINANGDFTFDPDPNYTGPVPSATYTVSDGTLTDTAVLSFANVTAVNDAPADGNETPSTNQDVTLTVPVATGLLANLVDPDGGTPTITGYTIAGVTGAPTLGSPFTIPSVGDITINTDGSYTFDPLPTFVGAAPVITYTVSDGTATDTSTLSLSVNATGDTDGDGASDVNDIDDDNDGIIDTVERGPVVTSFLGWYHNDANGTSVAPYLDANLAPAVSAVGEIVVGSGFTVQPQRFEYVLSSSDSTTYAEALANNEYIELSFTLSREATLNSIEQGLIGTNSGGSGLGAYQLTGAISSDGFATSNLLFSDVTQPIPSPAGYESVFTSTARLLAPGTYSIRLYAYNEQNAVTFYDGAPIPEKTLSIDDITLRLSFNELVDTDADGISNDLDIDSDNDGITDNVEAQTTAGYIAPSGQAAAMVDANNDGLDDNYGPTGLTPVNTDSGATTTDTTPDYLDSDSDNDGLSDAAERGTAGPTTAATGLSTLATDADGDGLFDVFEGTSTNDGFDVNDENRDATTINLDGVPALNASGSNAVPFTTDLLFRDVNNPPVDSNETNTVTQNQTLTVADGAAGDLLLNATDADGDTLTITAYTVAGVTGTPTIGSPFTIPTVGTVTINANGSYSFAPVTNFTGTIPVITYTVSDGTLTDTSTLTLSLTAVNQPPVAVDDGPIAVTEDINATGNVITGPGTDTDLEGATLTVTEFTVAGVTGTFTAGSTATIPNVGTLVINANGDFVFDPETNYTGPVPSATYTITDGTLSDTAVLSFANVTAVNDAPVDGNETTSTNQDVTLTVSVATGLLANLVDPDGNTPTITGYTIAGVVVTPTIGSPFTIPSVGSILVNADGSYTFDPLPTFIGTVPVITYTVSDGAATDTSTLSLSVNATADTDGDNVADVDDIDDDNDGILDSVERGPTVTSFLGWYHNDANGTSVAPYLDPALTPVVSAVGEVIVGSGFTVLPQRFEYVLSNSDSTTYAEALANNEYIELSFTLSREATLNSIEQGLIGTDAGGSALGAYQLTGAISNNGFATSSLLFSDVTQPIPNPAGYESVFTSTTRLLAPGTYSIRLYAYNEQNAVTFYDGAPVPEKTLSIDDLTLRFSFNELVDTDADGISNDLDIDSDNDGITDNVEAQATDGYILPSGTAALMGDADGDGLDDVYDATTGAAGSLGLTPVNTDGADAPDYLDLNSDNDSLADIAERGAGPTTITSTTDTDKDGLLDIFEGANANDGFDVNDENLTGSNFNLSDADNDTAADGVGAVSLARDLDFRDNKLPPVLDLDNNDSSSTTGAGTGVNYETTYVENAPGVRIADTDFTLTDPDNDIVELSVILTDGQIGDTINFPSVMPGGITAAVVPVATLTAPGVMTITFTGTDTTTSADWQAVLNSITFLPSTNDVHNPNPADRHITVQASDVDGSQTALATATIHVTPENDPPTLDLDDDNSSGVNAGNVNITYTENDTPLPLHSNIITTDLDDTNYESATVTHTNPQTGDELYVNGAVVVAGDTGIVNGINFAVTTNGSGQPVITFTGSATKADYDAALQSVAFASSSENPSTVTRQITFVVNDGSQNSPVRTAFVAVTSVNDAPISIDPAGDPTIADDAMPPKTGSDTTALTPFNVKPYFSDPDNTATQLTFSLDPATTPSWMSLDASGNIVGTPPKDASQNTNMVGGADGVYTIKVIATDPSGLTGETTVTYTITNPPPVAVDDAFTVEENAGTFTSNVFTANPTTIDSDPDSDIFTVTSVAGVAANVNVAVDGSAGGKFTISSTGALTFVDDGDFEDLGVGETRDTTITYTITDADGESDTATVTIKVTGKNDAPVPVDPNDPGPNPTNPKPADPLTIVPVKNVTDGQVFTTTPLVDLKPYMVDPDGDPLTFTTTSPLPAGLTLNSDGTITGTVDPEASQGGDPTNPGFYTITVTVNDGTTNTPLTVRIDVSNPPPVAVDDTNSVGEDVASVTGNIITDALTGDKDTAPDSDILTVISAVQGANPITIGTPFTTAGGGVLTLNPDGSYDFKPGTAYNGLDAGETAKELITYTVDDGNGGTDTATLEITINGDNDKPVIVDPTDPGPDPKNPKPADPLTIVPVKNVTDGEVFTTTPLIALAPYAVDPDGEPLTFSTTSPLPAGLTLNPDGTVTGVIDPSASQGGDPTNPGLYVITVDVSDGTITTPLTLTIDVSNPPPVAVDDTNAVGEDVASVTGNVIADALTGDKDTAPDSDVLTIVSAVQGANPITIGTPFTTAGGGVLTLNADGSYDFKPGTAYNELDAGETAKELITYTVSDGNGGTDIATLEITVNGSNDAPVTVDPNDPGPDPTNPKPADPLTVVPVQNVMDGQVFTTTPLVDLKPYIIDPDDEPVTFTTTSPLPAGLTLNPDGTITGTVDPEASQGGDPTNPGFYTITVNVSDGTTTTPLTVRIDVSNPPPVAVDDTNSVGEDEASVTGNVITDALTGDKDTAPDSDLLTVTAAEQAGNPIAIGTPFTTAGGGLLTLNADGSYTFEPGNSYNGLDAGETAKELITYTVSDGNGGTDTATLEITINGDNDKPVIVDPTDPGPDPQNPKPADPLTIVPVQSVEDSQAFPPGTPLIALAPYAVDPDGEPVTFTTTSPLPAGLTLNPDGTITGTVDKAASQGGDDPINNPGFYTLTVDVSDGTTTTPLKVRIDVSNPPPVAVDDTGLVTEDIVAIGNVLTGLGADSDPDGDDIFVTGFTIPGLAGSFLPDAVATIPNVGQFTLSASGDYIFSPAPNYDGPIPAITYTISDGEGGTASAQLLLTIEPVNDRPVIIDPSNPGTPLNPTPAPNPTSVIPPINTADSSTPTPLDVSSYVRDPENRPLTYVATGLPPGLMLDPTTGVISGTLTSDASQGGPNGDGTYPIEVTIKDPEGLEVKTIVTYIVSNPAPVAVNDSQTLSEDTPQAVGNLLTGPGVADPGADSDPDGDDIAVVSASYKGQPITPDMPFTLPNGATILIKPNGDYVFTPGIAYNGLPLGDSVLEEIIYTIEDSDGAQATATLALTIEGENDTPRIIDPNDPANPDGGTGLPLIEGVDDKPLVIPTKQVFADPDGEPLRFTATGLPPGLSIDPLTGLISGTLPRDASQGGPNGDGVYSITVTGTDPQGASVSTTFPVSISNPPPIAVDDTAVAPAGVPTNITLLGNDSDPDGDPLTVISATSPNGKVVINPDGTLTFTADPSFFGDTVITYRISDGNGGFANAQVLVNVLPEIIAPQPSQPPTVEPPRSVAPVTILDGGLSVLLATRGNGDRGETSDIFRKFLENGSPRPEDSSGEFFTRTFLGSSLAMELGETSGGQKLWAEAIFHNGDFVLKIYEKDRNGKISMVNHSLSSNEDIRWLDKAGKDVHIGSPPVTADDLEITVEAQMSNGEVIRRTLIVEPRLGLLKQVKEALPLK
jgi:large repetitive protein